MSKQLKRVFSVVLAFLLVLTMMPGVVYAEGTTLDGITVEGLTVTYGQSMKANNALNGLSGTAAQSGGVKWAALATEINGITSASSIGQAVGSELTFTNNSGASATLEFTYELSAGTLIGVSDGKYKGELESGASLVITLISPTGRGATGTLKITGLSLSGDGDKTVTFRPATEGGKYTVNGEEVTETASKTAAAGAKYDLSATANEGYQFFGWYNDTKGVYVSYDAAIELTVAADQTIYPVFLSAETALFGVGSVKFNNLSDADAFAASSELKTIVLLNDGTLSGEHTVSAGNTLLIPYDDANTVHTQATSTAILNDSGNLWINQEWETPTAYRTLTMAADAKITVAGSLNVGGRHSAGPFLTAGSPSGDLGMIQMLGGSNITVADGGTLYCWGYIYGGGVVNVMDGGSVHENFQFSDFRGGTATLGVAQTFIVFPISQYYVQNIEVATIFNYGASEYVWGSIYMQSEIFSTAVKFIGNDPSLCMFVPGENGTVTKTYDPITDRLIIDVDGGGSINPMALELGGTAINTETFPLPINSNMTININSGIVALDQSLALLPGVKMTIAEEATLSLKSAEPLKNENGQYVHYTGSNNLIVYDRDQWLSAYQPVYNEGGTLVGANKVDTYFVYTNQNLKRLQPVAYSPTRTYARTEDNLVDAVVDINGKLITDGYIYTTVDVDIAAFLTSGQAIITGGGANVISSQGTGNLIMNNGSGSDYITLQPIQDGTEFTLAYIPMVSARLQNEDGTYFDTMGAAAGAEFSYCEHCDRWFAVTDEPHQVEITWVVDGVASTQEVCVGTQPVYNQGTDPEKDGFTFLGWSTSADGEVLAELPTVTAEVAYFARFEENVQGLKGDVNLDGSVDMDDVVALMQHVLKAETITDDTALVNGEVTGNDSLDMDDVVKLMQYVLKAIDSLD